jgi:hypothetical protein
VSARALRVYRWALTCYPRDFRRQYGADMVALLADQLRDENPARVWARAVADLAISIPTRHLEVHMNRPPSFLLTSLFAGLSVAGVALVAIGGAGGATITAGGAVAVLCGILAFLAWRDARRVGVGRAADRWWKVLAPGVAALAIFAVITTNEVSERMWTLMMADLVIGLTLVSAGLILAMARFTRSREQAAR